jgi:hypothetical protein
VKFKILTGCLLGVLSLGVASGQSQKSHNQSFKPSTLDPEESKAVLQFADIFTQRLRETRNLSPLVDDMFCNNFGRFLTEDGWWAGLVGLPFQLAKQLDENERRRLYTTQFSLEYLFKLYYASKVPFTEENLKTSASLPSKVVDYLKSSNPPTGEIRSPEEARRYLSILENTLRLMRDETASNPPEETEQFKNNLVSFKKHLQEPDNPWGQPFVTPIAKEFFGYPKGTPLIKLEIPFHNALILVKENGQFKIILAMTMIPPD